MCALGEGTVGEVDVVGGAEEEDSFAVGWRVLDRFCVVGGWEGDDGG